MKEKTEQFEKQSKADFASHEKALKAKTNLVRDADLEKAKLNSNNAKLTNEIQKLTSKLAESAKERTELTNRISEGVKKAEALKKEITAAEAKVAESKQNYEFKYNTELSKVVAEKDMKISQLAQSIKELQDVIEKLKKGVPECTPEDIRGIEVF